MIILLLICYSIFEKRLSTCRATYVVRKRNQRYNIYFHLKINKIQNTTTNLFSMFFLKLVYLHAV